MAIIEPKEQRRIIREKKTWLRNHAIKLIKYRFDRDVYKIETMPSKIFSQRVYIQLRNNPALNIDVNLDYDPHVLINVNVYEASVEDMPDCKKAIDEVEKLGNEWVALLKSEGKL